MIAIEHCHLNYPCVQRWEALEPVIDSPCVRYCSLCQSAVHLVECEQELIVLARRGKCVAVLRERGVVTADVRYACDPAG
jgi:hypothetical protein